jgi:hypothetical protein
LPLISIELRSFYLNILDNFFYKTWKTLCLLPKIPLTQINQCQYHVNYVWSCTTRVLKSLFPWIKLTKISTSQFFQFSRYDVIIGSTIFNGDADKQPLCFLRFFRFLHVNLKTWFIFTSKIIAWLSMVFQLCGYLSCDLSLSSAQLSLFRKWTTLMKDTALLDSS